MKSFDPEKDKRWETPRNNGVIWSLVSVAALVILLFLWKKFPGNEPSPDDLVVYCAAGIRLPVEEAARAFEEEFGSEISDSEAEKILTVGDAIKFIEGKSNQ